MENLVTIVEVGAYSERQYQKQDGNRMVPRNILRAVG